ncbi:MAG: acetyltransferase [Kiritimatiellae bacterium]|nr:acetyltransferase [Kiritimatiellia bacterium]
MTQREIFIVGAGGFGREAAWTLDRLNGVNPAWRLLGFADDAPEKASGTFAGYPLLGTVADTARMHPTAAAFIAIGDNAVREKISALLGARDFPALVDPSADVAPSAEIMPGAFVGPQAVVSVGARIGRFAIVNARSGIGHDTEVGDFAQICPGATLSGNTTVGAFALVASNACTVPGVKIGSWARISAGTPAYGDVADGATLSPFGLLRPEARTLT